MPNEKEEKIFGVPIQEWFNKILSGVGSVHMRLHIAHDGGIYPGLFSSNGKNIYNFDPIFPHPGDVIDLKDFPVDMSRVKFSLE